MAFVEVLLSLSRPTWDYTRWGLMIFFGAEVLEVLYLLHGIGLSGANLEALRSVGEFVSSSGLPWLVGGDFNVEPPSVQDSEFLDVARGKLLAPDVVGTCSTTGGMRLNDYFL
eukprot:7323015-Pyramimonas_sp.AAC.1